MASPDDIRRLALALPEAVEADHHGMPSFRVRGKIFSTIHVAHPRMMVKLDPEDQHNLAEARPGVVEPVPGYWGRKGSTFVWYEQADEGLIAMLLVMAHAGVAPKRGPRAARGEERRAKEAAVLQLFVKQYARKAQKGVEPNDRHYDRKIEDRVRRMPPGKLDALLRDGEDGASD